MDLLLCAAENNSEKHVENLGSWGGGGEVDGCSVLAQQRDIFSDEHC